MGAGGDLGNHPAIGAMRLVLAGDALGKNAPPGRDERCCGLIAAGFYAKDPPHPGFHWT